MKCSDSKRQTLLFLMMIVVSLISFVSSAVAQKNTGSVTGRVIDLNGNPVVGLPVFIAPLDVGGDGDMWTVFLPNEYAQLRRAHTDLEGRFSVTDIPSGPVYISALPDDIDERLPKDFEKLVDEFISIEWTETTQNDVEALVSSNFGMDSIDFEPDVEILFIRVQGLTLYARNDSAEIAFGVKSGALMKDVEVTVQPRMRVRGRVLFKDGTPLANTRVGLYARSRTVDGSGSSGSGGDLWTDTEGYFVYYIDEKDDPAFYTFSVEYQDLTVEAEPIRLDPGDRFDGLTLTFDSEPIPPNNRLRKSKLTSWNRFHPHGKYRQSQQHLMTYGSSIPKMGTPISGFTAKLVTMRLSKQPKKRRISSRLMTQQSRRGWKRFLDTNSIGSDSVVFPRQARFLSGQKNGGSGITATLLPMPTGYPMSSFLKFWMPVKETMPS